MATATGIGEDTGVVRWTNDTGSSVAVNTIVSLESGAGVAAVTIANGAEGIVYRSGKFELEKLTSSATDHVFEAGDLLYLDASTGKLTKSKAGNSFFGIATESAAQSATKAWAVLAPASASQVATVTETVSPWSLRVHDSGAVLPVAAANDDLGVVLGTFGTNAPTIQGVDFGGTSTTAYARLLYVLPSNYVAGTDVTVTAFAGMLTTVSDGTCALDVEAYLVDTSDGTEGDDLCETAAQSINSLTLASKAFVVAGDDLSPGDIVDIRLKVTGSDTGNAGVMVPVITKVSVGTSRDVARQ